MRLHNSGTAPGPFDIPPLRPDNFSQLLKCRVRGQRVIPPNSDLSVSRRTRRLESCSQVPACGHIHKEISEDVRFLRTLWQILGPSPPPSRAKKVTLFRLHVAVPAGPSSNTRTPADSRSFSSRASVALRVTDLPPRPSRYLAQ